MAEKDKLLAYPLIEELVYRSNINTKQLNSMLKSIDESVLRAILRGNEMQSLMNKIAIGLTSGYKSLELHNQIYNSYPTTLEIPSGEYGGMMYATAFGSTIGGRRNESAGIVTLDWENRKKASKIPVYDERVNPNVTITVDGTLREPDDPAYYCLDQTAETFWIEEASAGAHTMVIDLPPSISKKFNYLELVPFPIFGVEITSVEYTDLQSVTKTIYPANENPFYNPTGPLTFHLSPKEWNNSITINYRVKDGVNAMGFTHIDVSSIDYLNTTTDIVMPFENVPTVDHNGDPITTIDPVTLDLDYYINGSQIEDHENFIQEIRLMDTEDGTGNLSEKLKIKPGPQTIGATSLSINNGGDNALYLKMTINESRMTSPVIRGASLEWRE